MPTVTHHRGVKALRDLADQLEAEPQGAMAAEFDRALNVMGSGDDDVLSVFFAVVVAAKDVAA